MLLVLLLSCAKPAPPEVAVEVAVERFDVPSSDAELWSLPRPTVGWVHRGVQLLGASEGVLVVQRRHRRAGEETVLLGIAPDSGAVRWEAPLGGYAFGRVEVQADRVQFDRVQFDRVQAGSDDPDTRCLALDDGAITPCRAVSAPAALDRGAYRQGGAHRLGGRFTTPEGTVFMVPVDLDQLLVVDGHLVLASRDVVAGVDPGRPQPSLGDAGIDGVLADPLITEARVADALDGPDAFVRDVDRHRDALIAALPDQRPEVQRGLARLAAQRRWYDASAVVAAQVRAQPGVGEQREVLHLLERFVDGRAVPALTALLATPDLDGELRVAAAALLGAAATPEGDAAQRGWLAEARVGGSCSDPVDQAVQAVVTALWAWHGLDGPFSLRGAEPPACLGEDARVVIEADAAPVDRERLGVIVRVDPPAISGPPVDGQRL